MSNKHGPTRSDLIFQLGFSVFGLLMVGAAHLHRGLPTGPGGWTLRKRVKGDHS